MDGTARGLTRAATAAFVGGALVAAPAIVTAHGLNVQYQSPLPLPVYLAGAAATVGLSFLFVLLRDVRAEQPDPGHLVRVPAPLRIAVRAIGLIGWLWIIVQGIAGGDSDASVATLFLWVYGWVGLAGLSAFVGPVWNWLDPFATLHDLGAALLRTLRIPSWEPAELPPAFRGWPAVVGLFVFIWLELVQRGGPAILFVVLVAYTGFTLAMMAQFGRDAWRMHGETFSVWFRVLGRLAPFGPVPATETADDPDDVDPDAVDTTVLRRRPFVSGLLESYWPMAEIVLVAFGTGSILFDGLSQTRPYFDLFGAPQLPLATLLLVTFLGVIAGAAVAVARGVSPNAIGAGLLPIAVGYLIAHYLTYLLVDGQRIVIAISDPLQNGSNLFGTAFYTPVSTFLAPGLTWTIQLAAVVGGHMLGAWAGHVVATRDAAEARGEAGFAPGEPDEPVAGQPEPAAATEPVAEGTSRGLRMREVPLALVMVGLTTLTLWSLGQAIVVTQPAQPAAALVRGLLGL